jgi:hypothetical protein
MSNHLISATYKRSLGSGTRKAVMALLADKASDDGRGIYASKQTMAEELDLSKKTVIRIFKEFLEEGLLVEVGPAPISCIGGHTINYSIVVSELLKLPLNGPGQRKFEQEKRSQGVTSPTVSPVKNGGESGPRVSPKPNKPNTPQPPQRDEGESCDIGDRVWGGVPGRTWNDGGRSQRSDESKRRRRRRKSQTTFVPPQPVRPQRAVRAKASENELSQAMHDAMRRCLGKEIYLPWLAHAAFLDEGDCVRVIARNEFHRDWIEQRFQPKLFGEARNAFGQHITHVKVEAEEHG